VGKRGRVGPGDHLDLGGADGQLGQGQLEQLDVIRGGVRRGVAGTQDRRQGFASGIEDGQQRVEPEAPLVGGRRSSLSECDPMRVPSKSMTYGVTLAAELTPLR
jgi:hypothetical protein